MNEQTLEAVRQWLAKRFSDILLVKLK